PLPDVELSPGGHLVLWADDDPDQGSLHLPFKLSSQGDALHLFEEDCTPVDAVTLPPLGENDTFARFPDGGETFAVCRYASPHRANGSECTPPAPPSLPDDVKFAAYSWP